MKKFRNLRADEIDVRINQIASNYCTMLLYKDARCDMNILDETVGALNWKREHTRDNANCIVSIYDEDKKEWISKEDTGTESSSEAEKGLASDSFKRACVNWGIGRELYSSPNIITFPRKDMGIKDKLEFFDKGDGRYTTKTYFWVEIIDYDENDNIKDLIIRDNKNHQINNAIASGGANGMITMDQYLLEMYQKKLITKETVLEYADNPEQLVRRLM